MLPFSVLPYIELKGLRDVIACVNDRVKFDLPIFGEPAPTVTWSKGDIPVEELGDKAIVVTTTDTHTKLVINSVKKAHEGTYHVTIANRSGQDAVKVAVKVLDRPAAPEAPMKTTVEGSVCNLLWKKVKEDGGSPIEHYQVRGGKKPG
jgi:Immunoglobulin I-set domain